MEELVKLGESQWLVSADFTSLHSEGVVCVQPALCQHSQAALSWPAPQMCPW